MRSEPKFKTPGLREYANNSPSPVAIPSGACVPFLSGSYWRGQYLAPPERLQGARQSETYVTGCISFGDERVATFDSSHGGASCAQ